MPAIEVSRRNGLSAIHMMRLNNGSSTRVMGSRVMVTSASPKVAAVGMTKPARVMVRPASSKVAPWLLLSARSTTGKGVFAQTKSIQRVATKGGVTPADACSAANANQFVRVPYTATYYFYRSR